MDPNANLAEQRAIASRLAGHAAPVSMTLAGRMGWDYDDAARIRDAERLAELVLALDEWLSKGGFLPEPWSGWQRD